MSDTQMQWAKEPDFSFMDPSDTEDHKESLIFPDYKPQLPGVNLKPNFHDYGAYLFQKEEDKDSEVSDEVSNHEENSDDDEEEKEQNILIKTLKQSLDNIKSGKIKYLDTPHMNILLLANCHQQILEQQKEILKLEDLLETKNDQIEECKKKIRRLKRELKEIKNN